MLIAFLAYKINQFSNATNPTQNIFVVTFAAENDVDYDLVKNI